MKVSDPVVITRRSPGSSAPAIRSSCPSRHQHYGKAVTLQFAVRTTGRLPRCRKAHLWTSVPTRNGSQHSAPWIQSGGQGHGQCADRSVRRDTRIDDRAAGASRSPLFVGRRHGVVDGGKPFPMTSRMRYLSYGRRAYLTSARTLWRILRRSWRT